MYDNKINLMREFNFKYRYQRQASPSNKFKLPPIHRRDQLSFSKKTIAFEERDDSWSKLKPLKSAKNINKSINSSIGSKYSYRYFMSKHDRKKTNKPTRIHTENNKKISEISQNMSEEVQGKTLQNFHRNVVINRDFIHNQIRKRNQSIKNDITESVKTQESPQTKTKSGLFDQLKKILKNPQQPNEKKSTESVKHSQKVIKALTKLKKLHPQKSLFSIRKQQSQIRELKNEDNYHEWRRMQIIESKPYYKESCFESEHERLVTITNKNSSTIRQYIDGHSKLLKMQEKKQKMLT